MINFSAKRYFNELLKRLCICIEPVTWAHECIQQIALWVWMCYFWWCYFLCSSMGITNSSDWRYLSPSDACRACPLYSHCSRVLWGCLLCGTEKTGAAERTCCLRSIRELTLLHPLVAPLRVGQDANSPSLQDNRAQHSRSHSCWVAWDLGSPIPGHLTPSLSGVGWAKNNNHLVIMKGQ